MLAPSQQKVKKKSKQIEKNERKAFWTLAVTSQCRTYVLQCTAVDVSDEFRFAFLFLQPKHQLRVFFGRKVLEITN
jgi:hypothetical protein